PTGGRPASNSSSIAACASAAYSATDPSWESGQMPTSRVGRAGWAVRIGKPRYACIESAETTSPRTRSATASATAVFPDAVGPKIARTLAGRNGGTRFPATLGILREERVGGKRGVLLRMDGAVLAEPGDRTRDSF